jgi:hypothetical protein
MAQVFLAEQLKRIKAMSEQMSRLRTFYEANQARLPSTDGREAELIATPPARRRSSRLSPRRRGR